ncbi:hypothetical protein ADK67_21860 [Saccharothrix sp. NRRL B-16348]|uniref:FAD-dependent monooxygenase n=1 Tax=Saccharothrix sp. NRRL B-16348 TaxID=1415542 RepID=UPI0006AF6A96|nr:FAD-dependent monooxygenase [Saccharothrix sp. NRRL B-16348]KOX23239.1 hypothetical protein ADK67_21860 [Saccharothrix sp. NRRL B-16348]
MSAHSAVVVGGGIAGLAVAGALLRDRWQVTVLERADEFAPVGAGLTLAPNAVRALDWLGLGSDLRERAVAQGAVGVRLADGSWLHRGRVEDLEAAFGSPGYALHRADLHAMLLDAARDADLRTGHRVTALTTDAATATVTFEAGSAGGHLQADLVVVADGVHSTGRSALFPAHPGPSYAGYVTWRGVVLEGAGDLAPDQSAVTETWGTGERFGVVPLADGRVYWFATASVPERSHGDDDLQDLRARFGRWHAPIPGLLAATPADALLRHDICYLRAPLPRYVSGRAVLVGDAAHAITPDLGQGACLALEDAVVLSDRLRHTADVPTALNAYDAARRPRTQRLVRTSAVVGRLAQWRNPVAVAARNALVRAIPDTVFLRLTSDTFSWRPPGR